MLFFCFQFRIFTAPFQHVGFADFWLADQLNSLVVALLDFQFIVCFYAHDWHVDGEYKIVETPNIYFQKLKKIKTLAVCCSTVWYFCNGNSVQVFTSNNITA